MCYLKHIRDGLNIYFNGSGNTEGNTAKEHFLDSSLNRRISCKIVEEINFTADIIPVIPDGIQAVILLLSSSPRPL